MFHALQAEHDSNSKSPRPFCPTRWCMRIKSLKTLYDNYAILNEFMQNLSKEKSENGAKASGFHKQLLKFDFLFHTRVMIIIFERVEILNSELQKVSLNFQEAHLKIKSIISSIQQQRNKCFEDIWEDILNKSNELKLKPLAKLTNKKIPKKFIYGSEPHSFSSAKDKFKVSFYEVLDVTISSLNDRFQKMLSTICVL